MKKVHFTFILLFCVSHLYSQISEKQLSAVDSLFSTWDSPNHPGGVVGIAKSGEVIFSKAYGLASLEYKVPNTENTIFNIASVSKQFTAMGLILLQQEGKLEFDDDIRKYLTDFPDFGATITIRNLLQHTSGLRSLHALLEMAGWRGDDSRDNADLYRFMLQQKDLNFQPNEEYMYSNTNYMLMVNIIEVITEKSFVEWMQKSVFNPLGMSNTYIEDVYSRVAPNNATSYYQGRDDNFYRAVEYWGYIGSANVHTTTEDMLKWLANFHSPQKGWETAFQKMLTKNKLNNGDNNRYAFGIFSHEVNGYQRIDHSGSTGGFRAFAGVYPEEELSIVVLGNFSSANTWGKSEQIAELLLPIKKENNHDDRIDLTTIDSIQLSEKKLAKFAGFYWDDHVNRTREMYVENGKLYERNAHHLNFYPIGSNKFIIREGEDEIYTCEFIPKEAGTFTMQRIYMSGLEIISQPYQFEETTEGNLLEYTGEYYSPELHTSYWISKDSMALSAFHPRHGDLEVSVQRKDYLRANWPLSNIRIFRDENGKVNGFFASNGRVKNMWFEKRKED